MTNRSGTDLNSARAGPQGEPQGQGSLIPMTLLR